MKNWDEDELGKFMRDNKDKFDKYPPGQECFFKLAVREISG